MKTNRKTHIVLLIFLIGAIVLGAGVKYLATSIATSESRLSMPIRQQTRRRTMML